MYTSIACLYFLPLIEAASRPPGCQVLVGTLRGVLPSADESARHRSRFEVTTDQREHTLFFDLTRHVGHQDIVVDPIKELLEIKFHAPAVTRCHVAASGFDGLVSASTRTKAVAVVREQRIEDWRELLQQCLLDQAIHDAGNTQLPCSAFGFGDVNGFT